MRISLTRKRRSPSPTCREGFDLSNRPPHMEGLPSSASKPSSGLPARRPLFADVGGGGVRRRCFAVSGCLGPVPMPTSCRSRIGSRRRCRRQPPRRARLRVAGMVVRPGPESYSTPFSLRRLWIDLSLVNF